MFCVSSALETTGWKETRCRESTASVSWSARVQAVGVIVPVTFLSRAVQTNHSLGHLLPPPDSSFKQILCPTRSAASLGMKNPSALCQWMRPPSRPFGSRHSQPKTVQIFPESCLNPEIGYHCLGKNTASSVTKEFTLKADATFQNRTRAKTCRNPVFTIHWSTVNHRCQGASRICVRKPPNSTQSKATSFLLDQAGFRLETWLGPLDQTTRRQIDPDTGGPRFIRICLNWIWYLSEVFSKPYLNPCCVILPTSFKIRLIRKNFTWCYFFELSGRYLRAVWSAATCRLEWSRVFQMLLTLQGFTLVDEVLLSTRCQGPDKIYYSIASLLPRDHTTSNDSGRSVLRRLGKDAQHPLTLIDLVARTVR